MKSISENGRVALTLGAVAALFGAVAAAFWFEDWRYSQPTPRPASLRQVPVGQLVRLDGAAALVPELDRSRADGKPVFLHFFNPGCPCSRFNLGHLRQLVQEHGGRARFVAILQGDTPQALKQGFAKTGLDMESVVDTDGRIAARMGVYSTPQAVLLSPSGGLVYRGNYNSARFCSTRATEYARIALESYLAKGSTPLAPRAATVAYGCPLPSNTQVLQ